MKKILLGFFIGVLVSTPIMVQAATNDTALLDQIKQAFLAAGWTAPASTTPTPPSNSNAQKPSDLLDLKNWYLGLPVNTAHEGNPDNIYQPELTGYEQRPWFYLNDAKDGVVFRANVDGATTENSAYPRSELREMNGSAKAAWDGKKGTHTMEIRQAITMTPKVKPDVIAGQIHGTSDDLMQIHLSGKLLRVKYADGKKYVEIDSNYQLGTIFTVKIQSAGGRVKVWYNGVQKADLAISSSTSYFKAGSYVNSNEDKGDAPDAYGEVVIYSLNVTHN